MAQLSSQIDASPEAMELAGGARAGFVGAFARTVRRGTRGSPVGKIAIGALVVVLTAGSVLGLSVLFRHLSDSAPVNAAGQVGGSGSPVAAPSSSGDATGQPANANPSKPNKPRAPNKGAQPTGNPAPKPVTYSNVAGLGCASNGASYAEYGWYTNGDAGWWTLGGGSFTGNGCNGKFTDMPMSGSDSDTPGQSIMWAFNVGSRAQSCTLALYVPTSSSARDVAARSAHFAVVHGTTPDNTTDANPSGEYFVDQSAHQSSWQGLGTHPVHNGMIGVKLTNRGTTSGYSMTHPHLAGGAVSIKCVAE